MDDLKLVKKAERIATKAHKGQLRWDGVTPYIEHPKRVAMTFTNKFACYLVLQIIAWLHDVVEDTSVTIQDLADHGFSLDVIGSINLLTLVKDESYLEYILKIKKDYLACQVKIADIQHNMSTAIKGNKHYSKSGKDKHELALWILMYT